MPEEFLSKPCDICGVRPAILMFRTYDGEQFGDEGLCPQCALERFSQEGGVTGVNNPEVLESINEMRQILANIAGHLRKMVQNPSSDDKHSFSDDDVCNVCGHSSTEISRIGNMGCPACYEQFAPLVKERLAKCAYGAKYQGLVPTRYRKIHFELLELEKLQVKLNALVRAEKYEQAAEIRKRILKLSGHS